MTRLTQAMNAALSQLRLAVRNRPAISAVVALVVLAVMVVAGFGVAHAGPGQNGTTLSAYKTETVHWDRTFNWTIDKEVNGQKLVSFTLQNGDSQPVTYTVTVTKSGSTDSFYVDGQICVTNGGAEATEGLSITDDLFVNPGGGFSPVSLGNPVDVSSEPIIPAFNGGTDADHLGDPVCYAYKITLVSLVAGATYKDTAHVTITNHSGHLGTPFGPNPSADCTDVTNTCIPPSSPTLINDTISVTDDHQGALGSTNATHTFTYPRTFTCPDDGGQNVNTATIDQTGQQSSAEVDVTCVAGGCTHTLGYWKTHAGGVGNNIDRVSGFLPIWLGTVNGAKSVDVTTASQAVYLLGMSGNASNGINKLYAQLLAAKFDIADGADGSSIAATSSAADTFLATHNAADWSSLSKTLQQQVLGWVTTLDNYNNGVTGPGHCVG